MREFGTFWLKWRGVVLSQVIRGNPLVLGGQEQELNFGIKRRWDDDVVFKNQDRGAPKKQQRFINDTIRCAVRALSCVQDVTVGEMPLGGALHCPILQFERDYPQCLSCACLFWSLSPSPTGLCYQFICSLCHVQVGLPPAIHGSIHQVSSPLVGGCGAAHRL